MNSSNQGLAIFTALKAGFNIEIGDVICVKGQRNYMPRATHPIDWEVCGKI